MKICAIFAVILVHVSAPLLVPFSPSPQWWIGNVYDAFSRWCVPLFVMVSGALVLPHAGAFGLTRHLTVRVRRILLPFVVWSILYFVYRATTKDEPISLATLLPGILTAPLYYHLWFVYMLLVLYLLAPAVGIFLQHAAAKYAWYIVGLWFVWASLVPILEGPLAVGVYLSPGMSAYSPLRLLGYFLLGHMLREARLPSRRVWAGLVSGFLLAALATLSGTWLLSRQAGQFDPFFYQYFSPSVAVMTVCLFVLVKDLCRARATAGPRADLSTSRRVHAVAASVFGVYLLHALVLEALRDGRLGFVIDQTSAFGAELPVALGIPVFAASVFLASLVPTMVLRRVPIVRDLLT